MLKTDLLVGTVGWDHETWVGGFYPDDLPEDWRLGFYTNRLRALLVPSSVWHDPECDTSQWQDDLYPEFRLVLEWEPPVGKDPVAEAQRLIELGRPIDDNIDAYLVALSEPQDSSVAGAIEVLKAHRPVCVLDRTGHGDPSLLAAASGHCWLADSQPQPPAGGDYLVALTSETHARTVRDIIDKIDAWAQASGDVAGAGLFFSGDGAADMAIQARTIAELMGV